MKHIPAHFVASGRLRSRANIILAFNQAIVDTTKSYACAFKLNIAFYSAVPGDEEALRKTITYIHETAPEVPVILDAKRADIGNTNNEYVAEAFVKFDADAVTVNPYFGQEGLKPFLEMGDKGIIVLCRTSNPGAAEFQNLPILITSRNDADDLGICKGDRHLSINLSVPLYEYVAMCVAKRWNEKGNCALVVGATAPNELKRVRSIVGDMQILIPGIGAQGGQLEATVKAGVDSNGTGMIINSSRGIIFASSGKDFAEAAAREAEKLNEEIKACLSPRV
jgi:orotidine-5'-phosphate decarboxylase